MLSGIFTLLPADKLILFTLEIFKFVSLIPPEVLPLKIKVPVLPLTIPVHQ